mmetsp:Transcript_8709/g.31379  ORF Transcript_8709/g.31379 Transcript_8709/m.31379 type:complete len:205 (-) Transcript_8709:887-1501(-)
MDPHLPAELRGVSLGQHAGKGGPRVGLPDLGGDQEGLSEAQRPRDLHLGVKAREREREGAQDSRGTCPDVVPAVGHVRDQHLRRPRPDQRAAFERVELPLSLFLSPAAAVDPEDPRHCDQQVKRQLPARHGGPWVQAPREVSPEPNQEGYALPQLGLLILRRFFGLPALAVLGPPPVVRPTPAPGAPGGDQDPLEELAEQRDEP